ncbi:MAG: hypothetical protein ABIG84_08220 [archaeon]
MQSRHDQTIFDSVKDLSLFSNLYPSLKEGIGKNIHVYNTTIKGVGKGAYNVERIMANDLEQGIARPIFILYDAMTGKQLDAVVPNTMKQLIDSGFYGDMTFHEFIKDTLISDLTTAGKDRELLEYIAKTDSVPYMANNNTLVKPKGNSKADNITAAFSESLDHMMLLPLANIISALEQDHSRDEIEAILDTYMANLSNGHYSNIAEQQEKRSGRLAKMISGINRSLLNVDARESYLDSVLPLSEENTSHMADTIKAAAMNYRSKHRLDTDSLYEIAKKSEQTMFAGQDETPYSFESQPYKSPGLLRSILGTTAGKITFTALVAALGAGIAGCIETDPAKYQEDMNSKISKDIGGPKNPDQYMKDSTLFKVEKVQTDAKSAPTPSIISLGKVDMKTLKTLPDGTSVVTPVPTPEDTPDKSTEADYISLTENNFFITPMGNGKYMITPAKENNWKTLNSYLIPEDLNSINILEESQKEKGREINNIIGDGSDYELYAFMTDDTLNLVMGSHLLEREHMIIYPTPSVTGNELLVPYTLTASYKDFRLKNNKYTTLGGGGYTDSIFVGNPIEDGKPIPQKNEVSSFNRIGDYPELILVQTPISAAIDTITLSRITGYKENKHHDSISEKIPLTMLDPERIKIKESKN